MNEENTPTAPQPSASVAQNFAVPFAIVVSGLAIAAAVYFGDSKKAPLPTATRQAPQNISLDRVTSADHILGNPKAKVIIVEYSDTECPYCKNFHETMNKIMNEYASDGKVAWIYRHFPIAGLHPKAHKEAEASECANKLGGNTKFWEYINKIFAITPSNNRLEEAELSKTAGAIGLNVAEFEKCLTNGEMKVVVDAGIASGVKAGVQGTPYSMILVDGKIIDTINGAQLYETVKTQIDSALK